MAEEEEVVVHHLYACVVDVLGASHLRPLGFPPSKLGLRSLVAAARAVGDQAWTLPRHFLDTS